MKDRITLLIKAKNLTAAQFAEEIGVQKSSISHIISGRNNASLDFIQKILLTYPDVNMDWLMFGKGPLFKSADTAVKVNTDVGLDAVQSLDLTHVDLFSELNPARSTDFRKEKDLNPEVNLGENASPEVIKNEINAPMKINKEEASVDSAVNESKNENFISGHYKTDTKVILKIVEFYSDNTYREFFPQ
jgi:transcriptional regulator with XRE-family HTH domain